MKKFFIILFLTMSIFSYSWQGNFKFSNKAIEAEYIPFDFGILELGIGTGMYKARNVEHSTPIYTVGKINIYKSQNGLNSFYTLVKFGYNYSGYGLGTAVGPLVLEKVFGNGDSRFTLGFRFGKYETKKNPPKKKIEYIDVKSIEN